MEKKSNKPKKSNTRNALVLIVVTLLLGGGGYWYSEIYMPEKKAKEARVQAEKERLEYERAKLERERSQPCYGVSFNYDITKSQLFFNVEHTLYAEIRNDSNRAKYATVSFTKKGSRGWSRTKTKRVKVSANDITSQEIDSYQFDSTCGSQCYYTNVKLSSCR